MGTGLCRGGATVPAHCRADARRGSRDSPSVSRSVAREDGRRIVEPRGPCLDRVAASSQDESAAYRSVIPTRALSCNSPRRIGPATAAGRPCREVSPISVPRRAPRMSRKDLCQEILKPPAATPSAALAQRSWLCLPPRLQSRAEKDCGDRCPKPVETHWLGRHSPWSAGSMNMPPSYRHPQASGSQSELHPPWSSWGVQGGLPGLRVRFCNAQKTLCLSYRV